MGVHHVAPDHGALPVSAGQIANTSQVFEIDAAGTEGLRTIRGLAALEIVGFVAVGIEEVRAEVGQELIVEIAQQLVGARLAGRDGPGDVTLGQWRITRELQDVFHMPERLQTGDEVHEARCSVTVELEKRLRVQRAGPGSDGWVPTKAEGVLGVEHQGVELEPNAQVEQRPQAVRGWHLASGNVEHDTPHLEIGCILDLAGPKATALVEKLQERFHRIAHTRRTGSDRLDTGALDSQAVGLAAVALAQQRQMGGQPAAVYVRLETHRDTTAVANSALQRMRGVHVRVRGVAREHDRHAIPERESALPLGEFLRGREQRRNGSGGAGWRHGASVYTHRAYARAERVGEAGGARCSGRTTRNARADTLHQVQGEGSSARAR